MDHMKRNMKQWVQEMIAADHKKAMPVLSFPSVQLMGITVRELISSAESQAKGMKLIADRVDASASVSLMDLSVEAEAFGATIRFSDNEVPTVTGAIVTDEDEAEAMQIPPVGAVRTGIYIDAIRKAVELITDRPVFAGVVGPFSLAGRLLDVSEIMVLCYEDPDMVHAVMRKTTRFLIDYVNAYKAAGANGIVMAEPLTGLLSPALAEEFSAPYVRQIVEVVQDEHFIVVYHNCGNNVLLMADILTACGASVYHFGNAVHLADMIPHIPADCLVMGNVDPAGQICNGTPESVKAATRQIMSECCHAPNFCISSGCDIPPQSPWANIDAFFEAVEEFYQG